MWGFNLKGIKAQRRAVKQAVAQEVSLPLTDEEKEKLEIDFICAHYTLMGLSFVIRLKNGKIIQRKVRATPQAVSEMFSTIGG